MCCGYILSDDSFMPWFHVQLCNATRCSNCGHFNCWNACNYWSIQACWIRNNCTWNHVFYGTCENRDRTGIEQLLDDGRGSLAWPAFNGWEHKRSGNGPTRAFVGLWGEVSYFDSKFCIKCVQFCLLWQQLGTAAVFVRFHRWTSFIRERREKSLPVPMFNTSRVWRETGIDVI